jgi:hypothetical protein
MWFTDFAKGIFKSEKRFSDGKKVICQRLDLAEPIRTETIDDKTTLLEFELDGKKRGERITRSDEGGKVQIKEQWWDDFYEKQDLKENCITRK